MRKRYLHNKSQFDTIQERFNIQQQDKRCLENEFRTQQEAISHTISYLKKSNLDFLNKK